MTRPDAVRYSVVVACLMALAGSASAQSYYTATLNGPLVGSDSPATGTALFTLNAAETQVDYVIEYSPLLGTETVAHIHNAPPGVIGPLFHDLEYGSPKVGTWNVGPFEVAELKAGRVNILIHSDLYPLAEIRGNLVFDAVASAELPAAGGVPARVELRSSYPNPFNPSTTIAYGLPAAGRVRLDIHDARGRLVKRLLDEFRPEGYGTVVWNGRDQAGSPVASGTYLYRIRMGGQTATRTFTLAK